MARGRFGRRVLGVLGGALAAAAPAVAAAEEGQRELPTPADMDQALLFVGLGLLAGFVLASLGYLYRRQRHLSWDYQLPHGALSEGQARSAGDDSH